MGEAKNKPTEFTLKYNVVERLSVWRMLGRSIACPVCKSGPVDTSDPRKVLRFGRLWKALNLDDFEDLSDDELKVLVKFESDDPDNSLNEFKLETDLFRYQLEILISRANILGNIIPTIRVFRQIIELAETNNIRLGPINDDTSGEDEIRQVNLSRKEIKLIWDVLCNPKTCANIVPMNADGTSMAYHGVPIDNPNNIREAKAFSRIMTSMLFDEVAFQPGKTLPEDGTDVVCSLDIEAINYLCDMVSRRSSVIINGAVRAIGVVQKLEDAKSVTGS